jgi:hypothetical protein
VFNAGSSNGQVIINNVVTALAQVRGAMTAARYLHDFSSAVSLADLTAVAPDGPGLDPATAQAILSACADAYGHSLLYDTGTDPRNVPAGYVYGASQKLVLGSRPG